MRGVTALPLSYRCIRAPRAGIEPTTNALSKALIAERLMSVHRSTAELPGNVLQHVGLNRDRRATFKGGA